MNISAPFITRPIATALLMAAFTFAHLNGIEFGDGVSGEDYISDPGTTPAADLVTYIYIPLAPAAAEPQGTSA